jgi:aspartate kinase
MSYKREITTLGRGGSDTTAVALAAALEAERSEIYSDVDGVYSADPRVVPEARHLPELDPATLQEMAESGAKVVCAQAVEWARKSGIAIYARATFDPMHGARETVVRKRAPGEQLSARAVSAEAAVVFGALDDARHTEALLAALGETGLAVKDLALGPRGATFVVPLLNAPDYDAARRTLTAAVPTLRLDDGLGVVSIVGDGLAATVEPLVRFRAALGSAGVAPHAITATPLRLGAVVPRDRLADAQRALHAAFVGDRA